ncbi:MAG: ROK family protein [Myxococcota bacterium]|nr:ROK family protein [Myxococcota bacterium]
MRIGVDLGGTKIEVLALDADGLELFRKRIATPQGDYQATVAAIVGLIRETEEAAAQQGHIGIGIPGALSRATGLIKNANSTCLIGHPLKEDVEEALERPVCLANDANCFAMSEATDGAAAGAKNVFGVILGTGVGGGLILHGQVIEGHNGIAGEWGHNPLPWPQDDERPGARCYCGRQGCIEAFLSGPALSRDYLAATGKEAIATEICAHAKADDEKAESILEHYENRLARALASVINLVDPEVIVLGGGLSNMERLYTNVPALWSRWVFSDRVDTTLVKNQHGDSSGVRGAAWLRQL